MKKKMKSKLFILFSIITLFSVVIFCYRKATDFGDSTVKTIKVFNEIHKDLKDKKNNPLLDSITNKLDSLDGMNIQQRPNPR